MFKTHEICFMRLRRGQSNLMAAPGYVAEVGIEQVYLGEALDELRSLDS